MGMDDEIGAFQNNRQLDEFKSQTSNLTFRVKGHVEFHSLENWTGSKKVLQFNG